MLPWALEVGGPTYVTDSDFIGLKVNQADRNQSELDCIFLGASFVWLSQSRLDNARTLLGPGKEANLIRCFSRVEASFSHRPDVACGNEPLRVYEIRSMNAGSVVVPLNDAPCSSRRWHSRIPFVSGKPSNHRWVLNKFFECRCPCSPESGRLPVDFQIRTVELFI